jgi:hypothetical protein
VIDAAQAENSIGQIADRAAPAFHNDDFETFVMIEVHVGCGENLAAGAMLGVH